MAVSQFGQLLNFSLFISFSMEKILRVEDSLYSSQNNIENGELILAVCTNFDPVSILVFIAVSSAIW